MDLLPSILILVLVKVYVSVITVMATGEVKNVTNQISHLMTEEVSYYVLKWLIVNLEHMSMEDHT